jgi:DNA-binding LacI/PurR family transcriptional regulator
VFSSNDQMALGAMYAANRAGRGIPSGLAVVGFDDIPEAAFLTPPLTTVRQDFAELGRRCVARLIGRIEGTTVEFDAPVAPVLVARESV